jgi:PAS domain-containing protein
MDLPLNVSEAWAQEEITQGNVAEKDREIVITRDPFLDPEWLEKKRKEEERRRQEEERRREEERKRQALKLEGIVQVGDRFVAVVDGKTLREGDVIRGRKILQVNRAGIRILYMGKVKNIPWKPKNNRGG